MGNLMVPSFDDIKGMEIKSPAELAILQEKYSKKFLGQTKQVC